MFAFAPLNVNVIVRTMQRAYRHHFRFLVLLMCDFWTTQLMLRAALAKADVFASALLGPFKLTGIYFPHGDRDVNMTGLKPGLQHQMSSNGRRCGRFN